MYWHQSLFGFDETKIGPAKLEKAPK